MGFKFMGEQEDPEFDTIEARGNVRIYNGSALDAQAVALSRRLALDSDHDEANEIAADLEVYVRALKWLDFPAELIRQNSADFVMLSAKERAAELGDDR